MLGCYTTVDGEPHREFFQCSHCGWAYSWKALAITITTHDTEEPVIYICAQCAKHALTIEHSPLLARAISAYRNAHT
jgi:hypothetical protein